MLGDLQDAFVAAIQAPSLPPPASLVRHGGAEPVRRFNTYRNNVYAGLIGVLEARFPAVQRLVGEEFFKAMARIFVDAGPPSTPVLLAYGAAFPDFIRSFAPLADEPYVADVASIEWHLNRAYHAADAPVLGPADFAGIAPDKIAQIGLRLAPAVAVVRSHYPAFSIWRANARPEAEGRIERGLSAEDTLICRRGLEVEAIRLPPGAHAFIAALIAGESLACGSAAGSGEAPDFALDVVLALLIREEAISGYCIKPMSLTQSPADAAE